MNPVTNPTHPSHITASRHFGAALAHLLMGHGEDAADHLGAAIGHALHPHLPAGANPAATGARVAGHIRTAAHKKA
jgi:hypothetical protein